MIFKDRIDAGRKLAEKLTKYIDRRDVTILAVPQGGVPVAFEVAKTFNARLDVFSDETFGILDQPERSLKASAAGGESRLNKSADEPLYISEVVIYEAADEKKSEIKRHERKYLDTISESDVYEKTIILIDDGLATGAKMRAAADVLRGFKPSKIIAAFPVVSPETYEMFRTKIDEIICAVTPQPFYGIGEWYKNFTQVTDKEVRDLLEESKMNLSANFTSRKNKPAIKNWSGDIINASRINQ